MIQDKKTLPWGMGMREGTHTLLVGEYIGTNSLKGNECFQCTEGRDYKTTLVNALNLPKYIIYTKKQLKQLG